jgi:tellurite resistance protein TerC
LGKFQAWLHGAMPYHWARRLVVAVIGSTVVLVGIALIVLPGPALIVIPIGLGILGLEFAWARRLLNHARDTADNFIRDVRGKNR